MGTKPAKVAHRPSWPIKAAKPGLFPVTEDSFAKRLYYPPVPGARAIWDLRSARKAPKGCDQAKLNTWQHIVRCYTNSNTAQSSLDQHCYMAPAWLRYQAASRASSAFAAGAGHNAAARS
eukprot:scaffold36142_cov59-Phaeocystis_antarctica.AAC.1